MQINPHKLSINRYIVELETRRLNLAQLILKKHTIEMKKVTLDRFIATHEANVTYAIATQKDENGKPAYPNETLRKCKVDEVLNGTVSSRETCTPKRKIVKQVSELTGGSKSYQKNVKDSDHLKMLVYKISAEIMTEDAMIKKFESLERLTFYDLESEVKK